MDYYSSQITKLIEELSKLPGVGAKSAQRLAFHIINMPKEQVEELAGAMTEARNHIRYCRECFTLTDQELCPICSSDKRNHKIIMVVENTRDLAAYEKTGKYDGVYHVLHGAISPMLGIGPGDIKLKELMQRLQSDVEEVIIATNSSLEGETTAMYLSKLIKPTGIKVTRIASGVPVGGDLEYIDEVTLLRALEGSCLLYTSVAKLPDRSAFAGSVATGDRLVRTMYRLTNAPLYEAVKMMSLTPAKLLGIDGRKGSICQGKEADLLLFDEDIQIELVMTRGKIQLRK